MMKLKILSRLIFIIIIVVISFMVYRIYAPVEIDKSFEGLYFDIENHEISEPVTVSIIGTITKDFWLKPETFVGEISFNSSSFKIIYPQLLGYISNYSLYLDLENRIPEEWKLHTADDTLKKFDAETHWRIYFDKKITSVVLVPMEKNDTGYSSSFERIAAPCDNPIDALRISRMLLSGGYE